MRPIHRPMPRRLRHLAVALAVHVLCTSAVATEPGRPVPPHELRRLLRHVGPLPTVPAALDA